MKMETKLKSIKLLKRGEDGVKLSKVEITRSSTTTIKKDIGYTNPVVPHPALFDSLQACKAELLEAAEDNFSLQAGEFMDTAKVKFTDAEKKKFRSLANDVHTEFAKKVVVNGISISDGKAKEGDTPMNVVISGYLVLKNNRVRLIGSDLIALNGTKRGFEPELEEKVLQVIEEAMVYDNRTEPEQLEMMENEDQD